MSLLARPGDFGVTLESLFVYDDDFVPPLVALGGRFWHLRAALWDCLPFEEHLTRTGRRITSGDP